MSLGLAMAMRGEFRTWLGCDPWARECEWHGDGMASHANIRCVCTEFDEKFALGVHC